VIREVARAKHGTDVMAGSEQHILRQEDS